MKVAVIVNAGAGSIGSAACDQRIAEIHEAFAAAGIEADVQACEPARLTETARGAAARGVDAVIAAGGDGTVSAVATGLVGGTVPLAVLPLGTLNHFARDIGMPSGDLAEAVRAIAAGTTTQLDVGEVNGRVFINNSSIGLYPELVTLRDVDRARNGRGKWIAMMIAAGRVLRRFRLLAVRVDTPHRTLTARTPFVFIGNNDYDTSVTGVGTRPTITSGRLSLYTVRCRGRLHMFWVLLRALLGRVEAVRELEAELVTEVGVSVRRSHRVRVAVDGEVTKMSSPLHFRIRAGALPVIVAPPRAAAISRDDAGPTPDPELPRAAVVNR